MMKLNIRNKILVNVLPIIFVSLSATGYISYRVASGIVLGGEKEDMAGTVDSIVRQLDEWFSDAAGNR